MLGFIRSVFAITAGASIGYAGSISGWSIDGVGAHAAALAACGVALFGCLSMMERA